MTSQSDPFGSCLVAVFGGAWVLWMIHTWCVAPLSAYVDYYLAWVIVIGSPLGLVVLCIVSTAMVSERAARRKEQAAARQQKICGQESSGRALLDRLRASAAASSSPPPEAPPTDAARQVRREELQQQLAALLHAREHLAESRVSPEALGQAVAETQQKISTVEAELAKLTAAPSLPAPPAASPPTLDGLALYDAAIAKSPDNGYLYAERAWRLKEMGELNGALTSAERALALLPGYERALNTRGAIRQDLRQFDEAVADYHAALRESPRTASYHGNLASAYSAQRKYREAIAAGKEALTLDGSLLYVHRILAFAYRALDRSEEAIYHLTFILDHNVQWEPRLLYERARLLDRQGNQTLARHDLLRLAHLEKADIAAYDFLIRVDPDEPRHYHQRATLRADHGDAVEDHLRAVARYEPIAYRLDARQRREYVECLLALVDVYRPGAEGAAPSIQERIAYGRSAVAQARDVADPELIVKSLRATRELALDSRAYDEAISLGYQLIDATPGLSPPSRAGYFTAYAYDSQVRALHAAGRSAKALDLAWSILPHGDTAFPRFNTQIVQCCFHVVDALLDRGDPLALTALARICEIFQEGADLRARRAIHGRLTHYHAAQCGWPLFDLTQAQAHAEQAWKLSTAADDRQYAAALLWAVHELQHAGSAAAVLEPLFADPMALRHVAAEGAKLLSEWQAPGAT